MPAVEKGTRSSVPPYPSPWIWMDRYWWIFGCSMKIFKTNPRFHSWICLLQLQKVKMHHKSMLLCCYVRTNVVVSIVRTTIFSNKLTLIRSSMMMMILVNIKMKIPMEKQTTSVIVAKTNCLTIMKLTMISLKLYLQQKLNAQQILIYRVGLPQPCIHNTGYIV